MSTKASRYDRVMALVSAAILATTVVCLWLGHALYAADVVGTVPMGTQTAVYAGPCTVQPLQLSGTCSEEVAR